jgi:multiple sugar transport system substrate-binding protein
METLNMLNASGNGPDVYEINREWLNSYIYKGYVADLTPVVDDNFVRKFTEQTIDVGKNSSRENKVYSFPSTQMTYRLIYNMDLFREAGLAPESPPKTLAELKKYAQIISDNQKGKRKYGFAQPMGELWIDFVQTMEASNCYSGVYFYDFKNSKYDFTGYQPWLRTIKEMNESGGIFPGMDSMKSDLAMAQFAEGNIGMMCVANWQVSLFFNQLQPKCEWGVAMPPAIDDSSAGKGKIAVNTAGWNVVNSDTKHLNESEKVWKFLYSNDYLGSLFEKCSAIPVAKDILEGKDYTKFDLNFMRLLPGDQDSMYPNTPLDTDEWQRKNAYMAALNGSQMEKILQDESYRLNSLRK